jgi:hypothetical protein
MASIVFLMAPVHQKMLKKSVERLAEQKALGPKSTPTSNFTGVDATKLAPVIKALANPEVFECDEEGKNGAILMAPVVSLMAPTALVHLKMLKKETTGNDELRRTKVVAVLLLIFLALGLLAWSS